MVTISGITLESRKTINKALFAFALTIVTPLAIAESHSFEGDEEGNEMTKPEKFEPVLWAEKAAAILEDQMGKSVDKRIPGKLLQHAECVAVFPHVIQFGIGFGGKTGTGMVSCRQADADIWGAPLYIQIGGLNVGTQLGAKNAQTVLLVMTDSGLDQLFTGKPIAEGEAGVSVGPVGRDVEAGLDVLLQTPLLSYTRSQGFYAGATLGGSVMASRKKVNKALYGDYDKPRDILFGTPEMPEGIAVLPDTLAKFSKPSS